MISTTIELPEHPFENKVIKGADLKVGGEILSNLYGSPEANHEVRNSEP